MANLFQKLKNNKTLINGAFFSAFSFINRGISFVLLIILARFILPAEYGRLSLFNTIVQLLGFFVVLSCQGFFSISYFQRKGELFRQDTTSILLIIAFCTTVLSSILLFSQNALAHLADLPPVFLWFSLIICVGDVLFYLLLDYMRIQEKVLKYGLLSCGFALVSFALSIYLVVYRGQNWQGRVYAHLILSVLTGLLGLGVIVYKRLLSSHVSWEGTKKILRWGIPLIPHQATMWIKQGCDRFIINAAHSIEAVGVFSFALNMTSIINMIGTAFNATNSVTIYQVLSSDNTNKEKIRLLKKQTKSIGIIYTAGFVVTIVAGTLLVWLALPKYQASVPYFWLLSVSGYMNCLYYLFVNYLFYYYKNKNIMLITFGTSLLHLGLSLLLSKYSLYWTSFIYIFTQAIVLIFIAKESLVIIKKNLVEVNE